MLVHARDGLYRPLFILLCSLICASVADEPNDPVVIRVKPRITTESGVIQMSDISDFRGGDPALRRKIASLDVAELASTQWHESLSRTQLELRLSLADIPISSYRLEGAEQTVVERTHPTVSDSHVVEVMQQALASHWQIHSDDIMVRLTTPLSKTAGSLSGMSASATLKPFLSDSVVPGRVHLKLGIYEGDRLTQTFSVALHVAVFRHVASPLRSIRRGDTITAEMVDVRRREISNADALAIATNVIGQTATRNLRAGAYITTDDVETRSPATVQPIAPVVIKRRDTVRAVARRPGLLVAIPNAEALDDGRVGQTIRLKNPRSNRVITGTVIDSTLVEISL